MVIILIGLFFPSFFFFFMVDLYNELLLLVINAGKYSLMEKSSEHKTLVSSLIPFPSLIATSFFAWKSLYQPKVLCWLTEQS